jgi:mannose-6-phosphate isomerase-like protein (cupin superfamily)
MPFRSKLDDKTMTNNNYRKVINTTENLQLVLMSLEPKEEIGFEKHKDATQFIRVESGNMTAIVNNKKFYLHTGDSITIYPGEIHNIINNSFDNYLKLYTIYSPPQHEDNLIEKYKTM